MKFNEFKKVVSNNHFLECVRLPIIYHESDSRCWTAIVDPGNLNIMVTYHVNKGNIGSSGFDMISSYKKSTLIPESELMDEIATLTAN